MATVKKVKAEAKQIKELWHDAHPLRAAVQTASGERVVAGCTYTPAGFASGREAEATHDVYGKPTSGQITVRDAIAKYGVEVVQAALDAGEVYIERLTKLVGPCWRSGYPSGQVDSHSGYYRSPNGIVHPVLWSEKYEWTDSTRIESVRGDISDIADLRIQANGVTIG